ncbi:hypothetical protein [Carboxydocella sp. ULO1]|uniref:hypothetical protein n=1 Tax=Carboxydocella sp. ULO1 TaxID=1926599 RepID=UPI0009AC1573|nr:hypothetical protein [Carboxydocella sp. ULO1]GAW28159.1 hypothetical protein ULO1_07290 [Carboxydocella sp. ULO1]
MLPVELVMALTVGFTESLKQTFRIPKQWLWLLVIALGAALNGLNAWAFGGPVLEAVKEGIIGAATASGIYGLTKAALKGGNADGGDR